MTIIRCARRHRAFISLELGALSLMLALGVSSGNAGLGVACPDPTTQPFRAWSDYAQYAAVR